MRPKIDAAVTAVTPQAMPRAPRERGPGEETARRVRERGERAVGEAIEETSVCVWTMASIVCLRGQQRPPWRADSLMIGSIILLVEMLGGKGGMGLECVY